MSDPEENEDDMPEDKDSTHSGEGEVDGDGDGAEDGESEVVVADVVVADVDRDGDSGEPRGEVDEEEDSSDDFFDAGEGAVLAGDRLSLRAASESGQSQSGSGGGTENDPVGPVTPSAAAGPTATIPHNNKNNKLTAVDFSSRTISSTSTDLDDEEWVDPTPIPPTPLESAPPTAFPPPIIAKTKSTSSAKSRKRKEPRVAHVTVPFPSSVAEGTQEDRPRRIPQRSTARGRDGRRTQSGGVKGVIAPDPDPGMAEPEDDPDGDDF